MGKDNKQPPPPDYSKQKGEIAKETAAEYQKKADAYNEAVKKYNESLSGFSTNLGDMRTNLANTSFVDFFDDPTTSINENMYNQYKTDLTGYQTGLGQLGLFDTDKPIFDKTIDTEYGTVTINDIPTLDKVNTNLYNQLVGSAASQLGQLGTMKSQRDAEEKRIQDFRNQLLGDLSLGSTGLNQLGIADERGMNQLERELAQLEARKTGFSSSILDQMLPGGFETFDTQKGVLTTGLQDLRNKRQAELDRISDFESGILTNVDDYSTRLGNMGIADADKIQALQDEISDLQKKSGRFSSELGFDFGDELAELSGVSRDVNRLSDKRDAELQRISDFETNLLDTARGIESAAETGSIYNANNLNAIADAIRDLKADRQGFTSELDFDFSNVDDPLTQGETALANLQAERKAALDDILSNVEGFGPALEGLELSDEAGIRDVQSNLREQRGALSEFTGGRVDNIKAQIALGLTSVDEKLAELSDKRNEIETQAQALRDKILNAQYYGTADLADPNAELTAMQDQVELFNAQQALDEIDAISKELNSQQYRLEQDERNVELRKQKERDDILSMMEGGVAQFPEFALQDPVALQTYLAMLNDEDEFTDTGIPAASAFSQNIIRA